VIVLSRIVGPTRPYMVLPYSPPEVIHGTASIPPLPWVVPQLCPPARSQMFTRGVDVSALWYILRTVVGNLFWSLSAIISFLNILSGTILLGVTVIKPTTDYEPMRSHLGLLYCLLYYYFHCFLLYPFLCISLFSRSLLVFALLCLFLRFWDAQRYIQMWKTRSNLRISRPRAKCMASWWKKGMVIVC